MSIVSGKTEAHLDMLDNMVVERLLNDKWSTFARVNNHRYYQFSIFIFKVNFVRQLILLCLHLISLTTAIWLRNPKPNQRLGEKIACYIAEICVLIGCIISIFALQAKEIYLQGFNYYIQNLVKQKFFLIEKFFFF
jgi:hypothetical protein